MSSSNFLFGFRGRALRIAIIALVVAPAFTLYGYNQSGLGPLSTLESFVQLSSQINTADVTGAEKANHSTKKGAVIATFQIGAFLGALSCLFVGDILGRRKTIFLGSILTLVGQVLQVSSFNLVQFVIGRVILGMGIGQFSVTVPIWLAECSSATHRGQDVICAGIFLCFGYAMCNWLDYAFFKLPASSLRWRLPLAVSLPLSLLILVAVFFLPESPRWLARKSRVHTTATLAALRDVPETHEAIQLEMAQIESSLELAAERDVSLWHLISRRNDGERLLYRFLLCFFIQFFQQMCGGSLISVYASTIFSENLGLGEDLSKILASCALTWKCICCFISFVAIDRWGRRGVFIVSGAGMAVCMAALAICTSFPSTNHRASIASAFFIFLFNFFYPIGFLGANFLYASEVAPVRLRVAMNSISTGNHWVWNFVITMVTPVALDTIGYRYYIMYAVMSAAICVSVFFFYPETMKRDLESLNNVFRDASTLWEVVPVARQLPYTVLDKDLVIDKEEMVEHASIVLKSF